VQYLTPVVWEALMWFDATYELRPTPGWGGVQFVRAWLPRSGGVGRQDAWLWDAVTIVGNALNARIVEANRG
jgi:hypothetical protein